MKRYRANNGNELEGELYKSGMEDGICEEHKKPYIRSEGGRLYPTNDDYVFTMDGETRKRILIKEVFEDNTTLI